MSYIFWDLLSLINCTKNVWLEHNYLFLVCLLVVKVCMFTKPTEYRECDKCAIDLCVSLQLNVNIFLYR